MFNPLRNHYGEEGEGEDIEYHLQLVHTAIEFEMNGPQYDPYQVYITTLSSRIGNQSALARELVNS